MEARGDVFKLPRIKLAKKYFIFFYIIFTFRVCWLEILDEICWIVSKSHAQCGRNFKLVAACCYESGSPLALQISGGRISAALISLPANADHDVTQRYLDSRFSQKRRPLSFIPGLIYDARRISGSPDEPTRSPSPT